MPAGHGAIHHHLVASFEIADAGAQAGDFAGRLGAYHQWQLALGESHAAKTPQIQMIERDRLDADLHFAFAGRRRIRHLGQDKFTKEALQFIRQVLHEVYIPANNGKIFDKGNAQA